MIQHYYPDMHIYMHQSTGNNLTWIKYFHNDFFSDYELIIKPSGTVQYTGRLKLTYSGIAGRICSDDWDDNDAKVACKEMNYPYGEAYSHYEAKTG